MHLKLIHHLYRDENNWTIPTEHQIEYDLEMKE